jgi:hypothetical protein
MLSARESGAFLKGDERILGDSDFVKSALRAAEDDFEIKTGTTWTRLIWIEWFRLLPGFLISSLRMSR